MSALVKMFGPPGADEANYGEQKFSRHEDGSFWVTPEAVDGLTRVGGFVVAPVAESALAEAAAAIVAHVTPAELAALVDAIAEAKS
jgi:hypothetical protein